MMNFKKGRNPKTESLKRFLKPEKKYQTQSIFQAFWWCFLSPFFYDAEATMDAFFRVLGFDCYDKHRFTQLLVTWSTQFGIFL